MSQSRVSDRELGQVELLHFLQVREMSHSSRCDLVSVVRGHLELAQILPIGERCESRIANRCSSEVDFFDIG
jgi:hypothetical protein